MRKEFGLHNLTNEAAKECHDVGTLFSVFLDNLETVCPPGREFALVKTKLQEACYFAKKSIGLEPSNWKSNENS